MIQEPEEDELGLARLLFFVMAIVIAVVIFIGVAA